MRFVFLLDVDDEIAVLVYEFWLGEVNPPSTGTPPHLAVWEGRWKPGGVGAWWRNVCVIVGMAFFFVGNMTTVVAFVCCDSTLAVVRVHVCVGEEGHKNGNKRIFERGAGCGATLDAVGISFNLHDICLDDLSGNIDGTDGIAEIRTAASVAPPFMKQTRVQGYRRGNISTQPSPFCMPT